MKISNDRLREFQAAYRRDFGEELTEQEAARMWLDLMDFMTLLFKRTPEEMRQSGNAP